MMINGLILQKETVLTIKQNLVDVNNISLYLARNQGKYL
jgi:hypothetical protein